MARYRVTIYGHTYEAMIDLIHKHRVDVLDHGARRLKENLYRAYAILDPDRISQLQAAGYQVERHEDVDETFKARQRDIGVGDRYKDRMP
jgi:hypothetical protein